MVYLATLASWLNVMTIPQLKAFDCADHDPIDEWVPPSESDVHYSLCLHIGPRGENRADLFYVNVATPQAISQHNLGWCFKQKGIVVNPYSWRVVLERIQEVLRCCPGNDWAQQAKLLANHFHWEFEDYRPA